MKLQMHRDLITEYSIAVALLLCRRQHSSGLLLHEPQHNQLAQHWLPVRFSSRGPCYNLGSPYRWTSSRHHNFFVAHPFGQLDTICRHTYLPSLLWPHHVRADPHRISPTICAFSAYTLLGSLVHTRRPGLCYRYCISCQSVRRRTRPADQSIPCNQSFRDTQYDALCSHHIHRRINPLFLHSLQTTNTRLCILHARRPLPSRNGTITGQQSDLLPHLHPVRHLRRLL